MSEVLKKSVVLVGRHWHEPKIHVFITNEQIGIQLQLEDFIKALAKETGNPATTLTVASLERKLLSAAGVVVEKMKDETARVV